MARANNEIGELEKTVLTLVRRPRLIRRDYWRAEVERQLGRADITGGDRQRLCALHHLLGDVPEAASTHVN